MSYKGEGKLVKKAKTMEPIEKYIKAAYKKLTGSVKDELHFRELTEDSVVTDSPLYGYTYIVKRCDDEQR